MSSSESIKPAYSRKDFISSSEIRWCSGCGDYFVHQALTATWASLGIPRENFAVVSGIGCSSRLPYYTETFGFHTIHGRAPTVAIGAKLANPDLSVWVISGDGDALSIGGNHFIHMLRRNPDINMVLFNNQIYGLTKGQASPTSKTGIQTKSSPMGSLDRPVSPIPLALAAGATFVARVVDTNPAMMREVFKAAAEHKGTSFIEVYTNCPIFNDGVHEPFESRKTRKDNTLELRNKEPMIFGKLADRGIVLDGLNARVSQQTDSDYSEEKLLVQDESNSQLAWLLGQMSYPEFPLPVGVFYRSDAPVYEEEVMKQETQSVTRHGPPDLKSLFHSGETWTVDPEKSEEPLL